MKGHRWFAALYDTCACAGDKRLTPLRRFVAGNASGRVLEVGFGTGANLDFYDWSKVESLEATEPDPYMLARGRKKTGKAPAGKVTMHEAAAEALPFPEAVFDTVVATLVLCTVQDLPRALTEIRRVLKPGGSLRLLEHVRAEGRIAGLQDFVQPVWGWCSAGCVLGRPTEDYIREAGFRLDVEQRMKFAPFMPAFAGVAT